MSNLLNKILCLGFEAVHKPFLLPFNRHNFIVMSPPIQINRETFFFAEYENKYLIVRINKLIINKKILLVPENNRYC